MSRVCLICPPRLLKLFSVAHKPAPPLGIAYIAGALKAAGHTVTVIDGLGEQPEATHPFNKDIVLNGMTYDEIIARIPADVEVIGLSLMFSTNWLSDRKFIDILGERFPAATIIAGGEHITAVPDFCIAQTKHLKVCVLGEGEETVVELLDVIEKGGDLNTVSGITFRSAGNIVTTQRRKRVLEIENIPWPAWELFPLNSYIENNISYGVSRGVLQIPLMATRGCPYSCTFCSSPLMWGTRYYMRSPHDVANEMQFLKETYNATNFDFYDLTAIIKREWIIEFAKEILHRKLDVTWQIPAGTRSEAIDAEVAGYLYRSGCRNITYAPESGSAEVLKAIKKKVVLSRMLQSLRHSYKEKMNVKINIMIGFPEEKHRHLFETMWFLVKASWVGVHDMAPAIFSPYPGSALFDNLVKTGKISLQNDEYFYRVIYSDTFFNSHFYNDNISKGAMRFFNIAFLVVFYGSNYLFRPMRFFRTVRNLVTGKFESRAEIALYEIVKRSIYNKPREKQVPVAATAEA